MTTNKKVNKVKAGAHMRWLRAGFSLLGAQPLRFAALSAVFVAFSQLCKASQVLLIFGGVMAYLVGVHIALTAASPTHEGLGQRLRSSVEVALVSSMVRTGLAVAVLSILMYVSGLSSVADFFWDSTYASFKPLVKNTPVAFRFLDATAMAAAVGLATSAVAFRSFMFHFPCMIVYRMGWRSAGVLSDEGESCNKETVLFALFYGVIGACLVFCFLPVLAPVYLSLCSSATAAAFGEIFVQPSEVGADVASGAVARSLTGRGR